MYLYRQWWCTWTDRNMPLTCYCCCGGELKWVQQKNNIIVLFAAVVLFGFGLIWFGIITQAVMRFVLIACHASRSCSEREERERDGGGCAVPWKCLTSVLCIYMLPIVFDVELLLPSECQEPNFLLLPLFLLLLLLLVQLLFQLPLHLRHFSRELEALRP